MKDYSVLPLKLKAAKCHFIQLGVNCPKTRSLDETGSSRLFLKAD